jgi:hypothetical protein
MQYFININAECKFIDSAAAKCTHGNKKTAWLVRHPGNFTFNKRTRESEIS